MLTNRTFLTLFFSLFFIIQNVQAICTSPTGSEGAIEYNSSLNSLQFCNGSEWVSMSSGGATKLKVVEDSSVQMLKPKDITSSGNTLFVLTPSSLVVLNITNQLNPTVIGEFTTDMNSRNTIVANGNYLYAAGSSNLKVYDVSNPASINEVGSYSNSYIGNADTINYSNNHIFIGNASSRRLVTVNVTSPSSPSLGSVFYNSDSMRSLTDFQISGNYAYTITTWGDFNIIDISNPNSISLVANVDNNDYFDGGVLAVNGNHVYVASGGSNGFTVVDVTNKSSPSVMGSFFPIDTQFFKEPTSVIVQGNLAIVSTNTRNTQTNGGNLISINISNASNPIVETKANSLGVRASGLSGLHKVGTTLYALDEVSSRLNIYSFNAKSNLINKPLTSLNSKNGVGVNTIQVKGNYAVMLNNSGEIYFYDISNSSNPVRLYETKLTNKQNNSFNLSAYYFDGQYLYAAENTYREIRIYDMTSNLNEPTFISALNDTKFYSIKEFAMTGNHLVLSSDSRDGIFILDISDKNNPTKVGELLDTTQLNGARGIRIEGNYLYVACYYGDSLSIVDITDKTSPSLVGTVSDSSALNGANDLEVIGNYAYVVGYQCDCITAVDISTPSTPTVGNSIASIPNYNDPLKIRKKDNNLYVTSVNSGVSVTDVSTAGTPVFVSKLYHGSKGGVDVLGNHLFTPGYNTFEIAKIYDITTPSTPSHVSDINFEGKINGINGIAISGNYAFALIETNEAIQVIDVTDKSNTSYGPSFTHNDLDNAEDIKIKGNYAYIVGNRFLTVLDISNPNAISYVTKLSLNTELYYADKLKIVGDTIYTISAIDDRLTLIDISTPATPVLSGTYKNSLLEEIKDFAIEGTKAYVMSYANDSVSVLDISNPSSISVMGTITDSENLKDPSSILINGNYAYVNVQYYAAVLDVSNPAAMKYLGTRGYTSFKDGVIINNTIFSLNSSGNSLSELDISDPGQVYRLQSSVMSDTNINSGKMIRSGNELYVTSSSRSQLYIFSIAPNSHPVKTEAVLDIAGAFGGAKEIAVKGNTAFVTNDSGKSITAINITDSENPTIISTLVSDVLIDLSQIAISGDYLYVVNGLESTLVTINIADESNMSISNTINNSLALAGTSKVVVDGNYLFAAAGTQRSVSAFSLTDPAKPTHVSNYKHNTNLYGVTGIAVSGNHLITCSKSSDTFTILDISDPANISLTSNIVDHSLIDRCEDLAVQGNYAFTIEEYDSTVAIIDISNKASPTVVGTYDDSSIMRNLNRIQVVGNFAYITSDYDSNLTVLDITTKTSPTLSMNVPFDSLTGKVNGFIIKGDYVISAGIEKDNLTIFKVKPLTSIGMCSNAGRYEYVSASNVMAFCNGSNLIPMGPSPGAGGPGCSTPTGPIGSLDFNSTSKKYQYCDGTNWVEI